MIFVAYINIHYHWLIVTSDFKVVVDPPTLFNNCWAAFCCCNCKSVNLPPHWLLESYGTVFIVMFRNQTSIHRMDLFFIWRKLTKLTRDTWSNNQQHCHLKIETKTKIKDNSEQDKQESTQTMHFAYLPGVFELLNRDVVAASHCLEWLQVLAISIRRMGLQ